MNSRYDADDVPQTLPLEIAERRIDSPHRSNQDQSPSRDPPSNVSERTRVSSNCAQDPRQNANNRSTGPCNRAAAGCKSDRVYWEEKAISNTVENMVEEQVYKELFHVLDMQAEE